MRNDKLNRVDKGREQLEGIVARASEEAEGLRYKEESEALFINAADVKSSPVRWLWFPFLSQGKLQILAGPPGAGKTTLALAMAAMVSRGGQWPDGSDAPRGRALIWSGEDDLSDTLTPRLQAHDADLSMIDFVPSTREAGVIRDFKPSTDLQLIDEAISENPPLLFIIDPIVSAISGDSHKNAEVRQGLEPLRNLAERHSMTVLGISHFSKGTRGGDVVERVTGSLAFGAACRGVLAAAKLAEDDERGSRLFCIAKSNVGPDEGGFAYDVEMTNIGDEISASRIVWRQPLEGTAYELLAQAETLATPEARSAEDEAVEFLRAELEAGRQKPPDVIKRAESEGISKSYLHRARKKLGIKTEREGFGGGCWWVFPDHTFHTSQENQTGNNEKYEKYGADPEKYDAESDYVTEVL